MCSWESYKTFLSLTCLHHHNKNTLYLPGFSAEGSDTARGLFGEVKSYFRRPEHRKDSNLSRPHHYCLLLLLLLLRMYPSPRGDRRRKRLDAQKGTAWWHIAHAIVTTAANTICAVSVGHNVSDDTILLITIAIVSIANNTL